MKINSIFLLLSLCATLSAQHQFNSWHLQEPERLIGYVDSCAVFWEGVHDNTYGGFYTSVDKTF